jgi:outer membrane lipoprotein-sorting protein
MKKILVVLSGILLSGFLGAQDLTLDTLVAKFLKVKGQDKYSKVQTMVASGKIILKNKMTVPLTVTLKRPDMFRYEYNVQGALTITAGNGKASWAIDPSSGTNDPQDLPTADAKKNTSSYSDPYTDWDNPFTNLNENTDKKELIGREDLNGTSVYNIMFTSEDNNIVNFYMDANSFYILKVSYKISFKGRTFVQEQVYSDFRKADGILMPFKVEMYTDSKRLLTMILEKCEYNQQVFDLMFKKPVKYK